MKNKIVWNKVTWYSKLVALILFVALPFIGFWLGIGYGKTIALLGVSGTLSSGASGSSTSGSGSCDALGQQGAPCSSAVTATPASNPYYSTVSEWQTDSRFDGGFTISYPIDFVTDENYSITPTTDWRLDANGAPGLKLLTITVPKVFEPQTNFSDATLTVGDSQSNTAIANCLTPDQSGGLSTSVATTTINGIVFSVFKFSGAGAGNLYDTTSYRTLHAGACYAVEYTIHSNQIANYPPAYNLKQFNESAISSVLDRIVGTFQF
jgi:hypothetical protein